MHWAASAHRPAEQDLIALFFSLQVLWQLLEGTERLPECGAACAPDADLWVRLPDPAQPEWAPALSQPDACMPLPAPQHCFQASRKGRTT